jgi:chromate reductase
MRILAISGSLRRDSHNTMLLRAAAELLPAGTELVLWEGLRDVPPYDQDDDVEPAPAAVAALREAVAGADAVLIATPEYNASIPGALKNALDWASRPIATNAFRGKDVAVIGSSMGMFGAVWAQAELRKVLATMGARVAEVEVAVGHSADKFDESGRLTDETVLAELVDALAVLTDATVSSPVSRQPDSRLPRSTYSSGSSGPSSSARRRCTTERESTPTSFPSSVTGTRSRSASSRKAKASPSGVAESRIAIGSSAMNPTGVVRGSSPFATTSRTSVFRVITPTSLPSSQTSTARTSGRISASPASCALAET